MINQYEFTKLVEYLFKETYGQNVEIFLQNGEKCQILQNAVKNLRFSYKPSGEDSCDTGYNEEEIRKAYMIAYYPYYISAAYELIKEKWFPRIANRGWKIKLDCLAGGPCPEIYGTVKALAESGKCKGVDVATYDLEKEWSPYQKITCKLCVESFSTDNFNIENWLFVNKFNISETADSLKNYSRYTSKGKTISLTERWNKQTDIFLLQNYLSHIEYTQQAVNNFLEWLKNMADIMKSGAYFIIIDLNYDSTRAVLENLTAGSDFLQSINLKHISSCTFGEPLKITHGNTLKILREKIFIGNYGDNSGLIPKKYTKYYYVILQKI